MFSIPLNPKLDNSQLQHFVEFCNKHKEVIYDIYFTCRMPPFIQDAMGDTFQSNTDDLIEVAFKVQEQTGIRISATFNNIEVRPSQENLDLWIQNFKQLYDYGIRSATIPHTHWVATGQIQKAMPDLQIKNTILRQVENAKDVANLGQSGFNYVNLHRDLMRDQESLARIRKAADKYDMKISLLANEGCAGGCAMMQEHFQFNNTRVGDSPQYFNDPISRVSCSKWDLTDPSSHLKKANFPPWREDWVELLNYVDVFKMHGRESIDRFYETLKIVENYHNKKEILVSGFEQYLDDTNLKDRPINAWRKIIKTCKFDCWDCNFCDKVYESKSEKQNNSKAITLVNTLVTHENNDYSNGIQGLTSNRVKKLLHELGKHSTMYLEIGSAMGSTAVSVLDTGIPVTCIDNWKQNVNPEGGAFELPDNSKDQFDNNTKQYGNLTVYNNDMLDVKLDKKYDLFFYDGPHDKVQTINAVKHYSKYWKDESILVFDDANWQGVVQGAVEGIQQTDFTIEIERMILNNVEDATKWWNGLYAVVVKKNDKHI